MNDRLEDRPALFKVYDWWTSDCPKDLEVIKGFFTGATGAEIGRKCDISRERVRQKLNRVFKTAQKAPYFHTCLFTQQRDNLVSEFQNNPSQVLYSVYSKILSLFSLNEKEFRKIDMGWIPTAVLIRTEGKLVRTPFLLPTNLLERMNRKVVFSKNGVKKLDVDTISLNNVFPNCNLNGFFTLEDPMDIKLLNLVPESIVTFKDVDGNSVYIRPHRVYTLKKHFHTMLNYYDEMSLVRVVNRLYDLTFRRGIKGEWSKKYIEAYIRSWPEVNFNSDGTVGLKQQYKKEINYKKMYSQPSQKSDVYKEQIADIVNQENASYKKIVRNLFDGNYKLMSVWFSHIILKNPLILLEVKKGTEGMIRYNYLSLKKPEYNIAGIDYGKTELSTLAVINNDKEIESVHVLKEKDEK